MTNTDTADVASTVRQCLELASAGSEVVRVTVNVPEAAAAVPEIKNDCMVLSALESTELALQCGLREDQIIISCKVSRPLHLIAVYRALAKRTRQPLHLGLTEAGMGMKGAIWSSTAMGILLNEGI